MVQYLSSTAPLTACHRRPISKVTLTPFTGDDNGDIGMHVGGMKIDFCMWNYHSIILKAAINLINDTIIMSSILLY